MRYAKVVLGISVEGPFDYSVPASLQDEIAIGARVRVPLRTQERIGYVVGLARRSRVKGVRPILSLIDRTGLLDKNTLTLARELSDYYCCSWGEAIEAALPEGIREGRDVKYSPGCQTASGPAAKAAIVVNEGKETLRQIVLLQDSSRNARLRWDRYIEEIGRELAETKTVLVLLPDSLSAARAADLITSRLGCSIAMLVRGKTSDAREWMRIKNGQAEVVIGTRSAVFAPLQRLGLIIIDEEHSHAYKQEQTPHYHPREIALMRSRLEGARVILGSASPTLESFYLTLKSAASLVRLKEEESRPEVKVLDLKRIGPFDRKKGIAISRYLLDSISLALAAGKKTLLFLNRKGFATVASCSACGYVIKCPRCNINLVFHYREKSLRCHYCNYSIAVPEVCPQCKAGYIRYSGAGTEKLESELYRNFPQARIRILEKEQDANQQEADILVATEYVIKEWRTAFDLVGVISIDSSLDRIDFRAAERTFSILQGLIGLAAGKAVIQTYLPQHHVFRSFLEQDPAVFYNEELRQRKQLAFPPYSHLGLIRLRGKSESRVKDAAEALFASLRTKARPGIKTASLNPGQPPKLRGNYYWQILLNAKDARRMSRFIKSCLKDFRQSSIIVTVDIDPV